MITTLHGLHSKTADYNKPNIVMTYGLRAIDIYNLDEETLSAENIANHLAKTERYTNCFPVGITYSVAQHSVMMSQTAMLMGNLKLAKFCLFHDGTEGLGILPDLNSPMKKLIGEDFKKLENTLFLAIVKAFDLDISQEVACKSLDKNIAQYEMTILMDKTYENSGLFWSEEEAKRIFLSQYKAIKDLEFYNQQDVNNN